MWITFQSQPRSDVHGDKYTRTTLQIALIESIQPTDYFGRYGCAITTRDGRTYTCIETHEAIVLRLKETATVQRLRDSPPIMG